MQSSESPDPIFQGTNFNAPPPGAPNIQTPGQPPKKRFRWLRKLALWTIGIIGSLLLIMVLMAAFFDRQITQQLIVLVNKSLKTELKAEDASLSLLAAFPKASVNLTNVRLKDAQGASLLAAQELSFRFDLASLFGDQIKINTVRIRDGAIRVVINAQGKTNTDIFKETKPAQPQTESNLQLGLEHAELQNMAVLYDNKPAQQTAELIVKQVNMAGNFSSKQYNLSTQAELKIIRIDTDSSRYLAGETVRYDAVLAVDVKKGLYDVQRMELSIGGNTFAVDGIAVAQPEYTDLNLKLTSQEGDISMIANLLPGQYHQYFRDFQSTGAYSCSGTLKGRVSKTDNPAIGFEVALRDGKVSSDKLQSPLRDVSFRARYNARPDGSGEFEIADFKGNFGGQPLGFNLKITDLNDPIVDFHCNGVIPLDGAYGLFNDEAIRSGDGKLYLQNLNVQGKYADMTSMSRIGSVAASGEIRFEDAQLMYNKVPVIMRQGVLRLQDNIFYADSLKLIVGRSDFALDGNAHNLLPVLFADSVNTTDALLEFSANMRTQNLDVDQLLGMFAVQETAAQVGQPTLDSLKVEKNAERKFNTAKLKGTFETSLGNFQYGKITGRNFDGKFTFDRSQLFIAGNMDVMQGNLKMDGVAHFDLRPWMSMRLLARDLDLQTMMAQAENFGQDVITDQNLHGRLSGRVALFTYWTETGDFDYDRLKMYADVQGKNGELVGLKMLEDFSTFIHIEDLRRVKFTDMQNYLEISNQQLYIPVMLMQSNAVNITLSGKQGFNNDIDYKIKVNAGQVLLNRIKKHDSDLDPLPADKGMFNLFYTVKGNLDKYDMKRGKKAVKAEFEASEARKRVISNALDFEFKEG
jgi:hypothetical protein